MKVNDIRNIFESVSGSYDTMNDLMSLGMHRLWKKEFVTNFALSPCSLVLDVACGTGDIPLLIFKNFSHLGIEVHCCDLTFSMLKKAREKIIYDYLKNENPIDALDSSCFFYNAQAEFLPFKDNLFDCYTTAFGLRNFSDIDKSIGEAYRVLKPGGSLHILEFSPPQGPLKNLFRFYSKNFFPLFGKIILDDKASYRYLAESINNFETPQLFSERFKNAGFLDVTWKTLFFDVVVSYQMQKPLL